MSCRGLPCEGLGGGMLENDKDVPGMDWDEFPWTSLDERGAVDGSIRKGRQVG